MPIQKFCCSGGSSIGFHVDKFLGQKARKRLKVSECFSLLDVQYYNQARRFVEIFGVQLNNQNFFGEISQILFALFVHRRLCLQCSYVAIAHLMQFCFFSVLCRLGNKRTVFFNKKEKKKKLIAAKSALVGLKGYLEI